MTDSAGSSVPRRQLGRLLKEAREKAGVTAPAAAAEIEVGRSKIYRIEAGESPLKRVEVLALAGLYGVDATMTEVLVALAAETKAQGWWASFDGAMPDWFELYVSLEAAASELRQYDPTIVPGLLQTEDYAAAVFRANPDHTDEKIARLVTLRLERQRLLARRAPRPPALDVILDEAVLRRPIADRAGMQGQLLRLAEASDAKNVHVRVLPFTAGPHRASQSGPFVILDFRAEGPRPAEPTTVYGEGLTGAVYLDKRSEIETYENAWNALDDLALNVEDSRELMRTLAKEYDDA
ncbi:helix-turn-helix domain-containing protein [Dactylosporangium sp. NBC_01737]|uniref:helix-turn-helix domain-containing protein n=1 Tax=Dactylosporangium sp. NBC_01737 TaxID=2975959 RepID=UPI002E110513|nr:helix-turn-helix domain-containing protein [Dactylosporangium sp. NBC_01737]